MKYWVVVFCGMMAGAAFAGEPADAAHAAAELFVFENEPIDPMIVVDFCGWVSDRGATLRTVDLMRATGSNRYFSESVSGDAGAGFRVATFANEGAVPSTAGYHCVGRLTNGDFVLRTFTNGGGSGVFMNLLVLRRVVLPAVDLGESPVSHAGLTLVATYPLGDRDDAQVSVDGDVVTVGVSRYREQAIRFDLAAAEVPAAPTR